MDSIEKLLETAERSEKMYVVSSKAYQSVNNLREKYKSQQMDTGIILQSLIEYTERQYIHLGLLDHQERAISGGLTMYSEKILKLFELGSAEFEAEFAVLLETLIPQAASGIELF